MPAEPRQKRRSVRLPTYDYRQAGAYFVTVRTHRRRCVLGTVADGRVQLSELGRIVERMWETIPEHHPHVALDAFVVMPNHVHGVLLFSERSARSPRSDQGGRGMARHAPTDIAADDAGMACHAPTSQTFDLRGFGRPQSGALGMVVGSFKAAATREINQRRNTPGARLWQRNYYEHVIRNEQDLLGVRRYIEQNPLRWHLDEDNPEVASRAAARTRPAENLRNE